MAPDGQTFMGWFGTGEWWTASRQSPAESSALYKGKSSPAKTLVSFLLAANEAINGRIDRIGPALELLDFSAYEEMPTPAARKQLAKSFFSVLDRLTFRV